MDSHIVRHEEAYYSGWSEERVKWFREHGRIVYHPIYDPEPIKNKPSTWATALAWALTALGLAGS